MNIGLLYTPVSIYQMTRGALVLFVGVFSVLFLRRRIWSYQSVSTLLDFVHTHRRCLRWISLIVVMAGVALVGYSGSLVKNVAKESLSGDKPTSANIQEAEDTQVGKVMIGQSQDLSTGHQRWLTFYGQGVSFILFAQVL
jgi:hypothetical protein